MTSSVPPSGATIHVLKYALLFLVGTLWGSQYIFIKTALEDLDPLDISFLRTALGAAVMAIACLIFLPRSGTRKLRRDSGSQWWLIAIIGIMETGLPALLIAYGQQEIESSVAAILLGTTPLFTVVFACFLLKQESPRVGLILGVLVGFAGLVLLFGLRTQTEAALDPISGGLILVAAIAFAISIVLLNKVRDIHPLPLSRDLLIWASLPLLPAWLIWGNPGSLNITWASGLSIAFLATLGGGAVFLIYIQLIRISGPTFASLSNYLVPLVGILLGISAGNEQIRTTDLIAMLVILAALFMTQPRGSEPAGNIRSPR